MVSTLVGECRGDRNVCVSWHPFRSELVSISSSGEAVLWRRQFTDKLLAFEELEENVVYTEGENEFDMVIDESTGKRIPAKYREHFVSDAFVASGSHIDTLSISNDEIDRPVHTPGSPPTSVELRKLVVLAARPDVAKGEMRLTTAVGLHG